MSEPIIIFEHVWKKFRLGERHDSLRDLFPSMARRLVRARSADELESQEFWALRDVSFDVRPGEAVGIIGPNGAGKSTVLKLLTRILRPTKGRCEVRGRVGALIEVAAGFHPDLTGRENVFLQGAIMGLRRQEVAEKLDDIVAFANTAEFIDTPVKRYSSGMNARLGFAIAAALDPAALLIDEVLAVGDLSFQQKCYERLRRYRERGTAIALVSHSMQAIAAVCDRVLLLRRDGPPLLGPVAEIVPAYLNRGSASLSSWAEVVFSEIAEIGPPGASFPFPPGRVVTIRFRIRALSDLPRCGWGFRVIRTDGLSVFDCGSTLEGHKPVTLRPGDVLDGVVRCRLNLGKGIYSVIALLYDEQRIWPEIDLGSIGNVVVEDASRGSDTIAHLDPEFEVARVQTSDLVGSPI